MTDRSELAILVETEARLDGAIAAARHAAEQAVEDARTRARVAASQLEARIALETARIADTIAAETTQREREIEARARAALARYEAMRGPEVARTLAQRLVAMSEEDT